VLSLRKCRVGVVGLGYVGLPLAVEFGKHFETVGFDVKEARIAELKAGKDSTLETTRKELKEAQYLTFTTSLQELKKCRVFIVTVPTPIDKYNRPDLTPLERASESVGKVLKRDDVVVYESTVYPGCTEEVCVPILERVSGLKYNKDFFCGYSPERINPGDKEHRLTTIRKITAGSTPEAAEFVDKLYGTIIKAGTHKASSIAVAEAAKVIENTQRDVNIALINELSLIFNRLGIDTEEVLVAAGTKWNFLPFRPGLVGGHCIGVDPYYLTHKAQEIGYHPEMILAGRRLNDNMALYVADQVVKLMNQRRIHVKDARVLSMNEQPQAYETYILASNLEPSQVRQSFTPPDSVPFWNLDETIAQTERAGLDATRYRLQYDVLLARPLLFVAMVFVAASVSLRFFRFGGVSRMVLGGVTAGFVLYVGTQLMEDLGASGLVVPTVAAWFPAVVGSLLGTLALLYQEDG